MAITEVTRFRLKPATTTSDLTLRAKLRRVSDILEQNLGSKRLIHWYQQTEDPRYVYIICERTTDAENQYPFVPSDLTKEYIELLQDDFDLSETETVYIHLSAWDIPIDAPIISIGTHKVAAKNKVALEKRFSETRYLVDEYVGSDKKGVGGWRVEEKDEDHLEWVLFFGWENWGHHYNFIKTEGFKEYGKILGLLESYESKHAKMLSL